MFARSPELTNIAPPGGSFATLPVRNSDNFAPQPFTNRQPANDLRGQGGAKCAGFRTTRKRKKILLPQNSRRFGAPSFVRFDL
jgi:hypothetical protein